MPLNAVASQINQGHTAKKKGIPQLPYHTFLASYTCQRHAAVPLGCCARPRYISFLF